nr:hypothetical protein Itr_chr05CG01600 [Ipomoea trifida]
MANEKTRSTQIKLKGGKIYQYKKAGGGFGAEKLKPRLDEKTCNNSAGDQLRGKLNFDAESVELINEVEARCSWSFAEFNL